MGLPWSLWPVGCSWNTPKGRKHTDQRPDPPRLAPADINPLNSQCCFIYTELISTIQVQNSYWLLTGLWFCTFSRLTSYRHYCWCCTALVWTQRYFRNLCSEQNSTITGTIELDLEEMTQPRDLALIAVHLRTYWGSDENNTSSAKSRPASGEVTSKFSQSAYRHFKFQQNNITHTKHTDNMFLPRMLMHVHVHKVEKLKGWLLP